MSVQSACLAQLRHRIANNKGRRPFCFSNPGIAFTRCLITSVPDRRDERIGIRPFLLSQTAVLKPGLRLDASIFCGSHLRLGSEADVR